MGRCALHTTRSLAVSHATSAVIPVSTSSCCIHGWRGRPRGRFLCGLLSGRWPVLALTARCSAVWAGVTSGSRLTWPNIAWRFSWSCHEHSLGQSGLWWWRWWRSHTSGFWVYIAGMTCWCLELLFFRFQQCLGLCTVQKDRDDKGIVQPQLCGQTQLFLSPDIRKLAHYAWRKSDSPMYFRGWPAWRADCAAEICELVRDFDRLP